MLARQSKEGQGFGMWLRKQTCHMKSPLFTMLENTLALSLNCLNSAFSFPKSRVSLAHKLRETFWLKLSQQVETSSVVHYSLIAELS